MKDKKCCKWCGGGAGAHQTCSNCPCHASTLEQKIFNSMREEWMNAILDVSVSNPVEANHKMADWWLSKFTAFKSSLKEQVEVKYGKEGSHSGSFGYQGILMGVESYQTPEDQMRDWFINLLK